MNETHFVSRTGWLRASVLGANDGLISTASLIVGVAATTSDVRQILTAGAAGLVAGAMSMAAGEFVSVSSQSDTESADLAREREELISQPDFELAELAESFEARGVSASTALEVATQLSKANALDAHAREELGITEHLSAKPMQAAMASALTFALGAVLPLVVAFLVSGPGISLFVSVSTLFFLGILGALGAVAGGARIGIASLRVMFWGAAAMGATTLIGYLFGAVV